MPLATLLLLALLAPATAQPTREKCLSQPVLVCDLRPTAGNTVTGRVTFTSVYRENSARKCQVRVTATVTNLTPGGHGFHIHTYGDLNSEDGTSAGGHFSNPRGAPKMHGFPGSSRRHWGDFGSLEALGNGVATYARVDDVVKMRGIVGRGMVVHALPDGGPEFQPSGAAGARQATCVIGYANPDLVD